MNDKADQVGRSTMQNEGMINVQIARIDDALSRLARLESASTSTSAAPSWSAGTTTRRDNIVSKKELKNVANFGTNNGPAYQDWVSDVKTATEQVDELMVHVIEWIDRILLRYRRRIPPMGDWLGSKPAGLGVVAEAALPPHER